MLLAYHDRSDGGLLATVAEMIFASRMGVTLTLSGSRVQLLKTLFSEEIGAVVQVAKSKLPQVQMVLDRNGIKAEAIGRVNDSGKLVVRSDEELGTQPRPRHDAEGMVRDELSHPGPA